jgi:hypothetical protein
LELRSRAFNDPSSTEVNKGIADAFDELVARDRG